ncbi:hypothetical protein K7432_001804 [Basidiobolus ranarum]|uniref:LysM domain-containing protein n=1 Tax=Basidiobolus ranarum TaxID=34480 RepID=A0ABR2X2H3_9FUNG
MVAPTCLVCYQELKTLCDPVSGVSLKLEDLYLTPCCSRIVCPSCLAENPRLLEYCPLCLQVRQPPLQENNPDSLDTKEFRSPPPYEEELPQYGGSEKYTDKDEKSSFIDDNVVHYVKPKDTLFGIALKYGVEITDLKKVNRMFDNNVIARRYLLIPGYFGPTESEPTPDEELKAAVKRFQLLSKCVDPNEAKYYMATNNYIMENALQAYQIDLQWEKDHPFDKAKSLAKDHVSSTSINPSCSNSSQDDTRQDKKPKKWFGIRY